MQLKELHIERNTHDFNFRGIAPGQTTGTIRFVNDSKADITLGLTAEHCQRLLEVVADAMVDTTTELANVLRKDIIEHAKPALPSA